MKKLSLLLALIFVFSVFVTACNNESTENSEASSEGIVDESTQQGEVIKTGVQVPQNPNETIISNGASYTKSVSAGEQYPDTYNTELTDGIRAPKITDNYGDECLSGYAANAGRLGRDVYCTLVIG
ncbi:MAG: hypothetical protein J6Q72_00775, partial [Clostridia bacterium]|nr:hypothetical protein [Clostridia bacterium]